MYGHPADATSRRDAYYQQPQQHASSSQMRTTLPPLAAATTAVPSGLPNPAGYHYPASHSSSNHQPLPSLSQVLSPSPPSSYSQSHLPSSHTYSLSHSNHSGSSSSPAIPYSSSSHLSRPSGYALEPARNVASTQHPSSVSHAPLQQSTVRPAYSPLPPHLAPAIGRPSSTPPPLRYGSPPPITHEPSSPPASPTLANGRPYACQERDCGAGFSRPHDLKRHMLSVHQRSEETAPRCPSCNRPFSRNDALRRHQSRGCQHG